MNVEAVNSRVMKTVQKIKQFLGKHIKLILSLIFSLTFAEIMYATYFRDKPLFGFILLGELLCGIAFFFFSYYFGPSLLELLNRGIESAFVKTLTKAFTNIGKTQSMFFNEIANTRAVTHNNKNGRSKSVVLDTSAIIDGRIFSVIETGFMDNKIIVTQNVLEELKNMADKKDKQKREKGRRALDDLRNYKKKHGRSSFDLVTLKTAPDKVDNSLVELCKKNGYKLVTLDYNLNKTAQVAGVQVLNLNKLANEIKVKLLPGDVLSLALVQKGKEIGQSVGYLDDGTMIIVTDSEGFIGSTKEVIVEKVLQTSAGQLIFAKLKE
jgi:uncharacterized protein YacL